MLKRLTAGIVAGLVGGLGLAALFTVVTPSSAGLVITSLMQLIASAAGSNRVVTGWVWTLGASALLGAVFALALGRRAWRVETATGVALALAVGVWLVEALFGVPVLFREPPVAGLHDLRLWPTAIVLFVVDLLFASILVVVVSTVARRRPA